MITADTYTPVGLEFLEDPHVYTYLGRPLISVTGALRAAGLVDLMFVSEADRDRGIKVHKAIERLHRHDYPNGDGLPLGDVLDPITGPYMRAFHRFMSESAFRVDACEERLCDPALRCAGTLDLRGHFVQALERCVDRVDVVDVKTGSTPPWVPYQLAGYVRLLPEPVRHRCLRWCLTLRADGSYSLHPLLGRNDERIFLAAVVIAQAKRGWL